MADQSADPPAPNQSSTPQIPRFPAEEEASMVADARATRASANALFAISDYDGAVAGYERALAALPAYLGYEAALVRANMAACFLKTREWKRAVGEADRGLGALDECEEERARPAVEDVAEEEEEADGGAEVGREVPSEEDVLRMRRKLLLRRAKAGTEMGGWAALQRALEDYTALSKLEGLPAVDRKTVRDAMRDLPPRVEEAQKSEMGEVMGKLKELGNGILKPFGLSTDNFSMVKDGSTGGYNLSFQQG